MKILIVEDDPTMAMFLQKSFHHEGYFVDIAHDGEAGLKKALENTYNILILDLLLPKLDGHSLIKKLRSKGNMTPVVIVTAIQDSETNIHLLESGADDYMQKPFSFKLLMAKISTILRRTGGNSPDHVMLVIDDLSIDPDNKEVKRGGKPINLRKKEFMLLEYLFRNKDRVISPSKILEDVWDFNYDTSSNTIGAHIYSLRKKIDKGCGKKLIHTIHGIGYQFTIKQKN